MDLTELNLPKAEWVLVTPDMARGWLDQNTRNRLMRQGHVIELADDMAAGRFMPVGDPIRFDIEGTQIDGQHRSAAVILSGVPTYFLVIRDLPVEAMTVIDSGISRTGGDMVRTTISKEYANQISAAATIGVIRDWGRMERSDSTASPRISPVVRHEWVSNNIDIKEAIKFVMPLASSIPLRPAPMFYTAMLTRRIDVAASEEFFNSLANKMTNGHGDARAALLNWGARAQANKRAARTAEIVYALFRTWNAYRAQESMVKILVQKEGGIAIPKLLGY